MRARLKTRRISEYRFTVTTGTSGSATSLKDISTKSDDRWFLWLRLAYLRRRGRAFNGKSYDLRCCLRLIYPSSSEVRCSRKCLGSCLLAVEAWIPYLDNVDAIIFLVPISAFDQVGSWVSQFLQYHHAPSSLGARRRS